MWRNYNDGYVTEVKDTREIFDRDCETRPSTPYFLVYIKDELTDMLVDSVCRDIKEVPKDPQDAEMLDVGVDSSYDLIDLSNTEVAKPYLNPTLTEPEALGWDSSASWGHNW
jgi:hypothetical protein